MSNVEPGDRAASLTRAAVGHAGLRVAIAQVSSVVGDVEENLENLAEAIATAASEGTDLLVTPELMITGYHPETAAKLARRGTEMRQRVAEMAAEAGLAVVISTPERVGTDNYITATLVSVAGVTLLHHRKTMLFSQDERRWFKPGRRRSDLVDIRGFKVALAICYEMEFPEHVRELAIAGADIIAVPTALEPGVADVVVEQVPRILIPARAIENQLAIAYANHAAPQCIGDSVIAGPLGPLATAGTNSEVLVLADVEREMLQASRKVNTYLPDAKDRRRTWVAGAAEVEGGV